MPVTAFQMPDVRLNLQVFCGEVGAPDLDALIGIIADPASHTFEHDVLGFFADDADVEELPLPVLADYRRRIAEVVEQSGFQGRLRVAQVADQPHTLEVLRFWERFSTGDARYRWTTRTFSALGPACAWLGLTGDETARVRAAVERVIDGSRPSATPDGPRARPV